MPFLEPGSEPSQSQGLLYAPLAFGDRDSPLVRLQAGFPPGTASSSHEAEPARTVACVELLKEDAPQSWDLAPAQRPRHRAEARRQGTSRVSASSHPRLVRADRVRMLGLVRGAPRHVRSWHVVRQCSSVAAHGQMPMFQVCGAGTGVGKTILSAGLLRSNAIAGNPGLYIKPVQSGYPNDDDSQKVRENAGAFAAKDSFAAITYLKLSEPTSPDLAAKLDNAQAMACADDTILQQLEDTIQQRALEFGRSGFGVVEGAGGVLSPSASGTLQADALRPLRLPAVLVGDPALGGISNTIAAFEALVSRGYDVPAIVIFEEDNPMLDNANTVHRHVGSEAVTVFSAPSLPGDDVKLREYFERGETSSFFDKLRMHLRHVEEKRVDRIAHMSRDASDVFWYPFTQHASFETGDSKKGVFAIDSAHGLDLKVHNEHGASRKMADVIGSWWTTGVGHGNVRVAKAIGAAAGRYGHVMFPEAAHEPAWNLTRQLLDEPGAGWANRVFFSDNGSTAVEVALKMAFRKRATDEPRRANLPYKVLSIDGCYHGDTHAAMDCCPKSDYNSKQSPWYQERVVAFQPPIACMQNGKWVVKDGERSSTAFTTREDIFSLARDGSEYYGRLSKNISELLGSAMFDIGALLLEPVMQGAGGMRVVDPAFQRALVRVCREQRVPVVFDEVFTGFWRLGALSGAKLLGVEPDVAAYGKLLTGGVAPLAVTLASKPVFEGFLGESKREALLHGHSFTANPIGCAAALESLAVYKDAGLSAHSEHPTRVYWDDELARDISELDGIDNVTNLGTVLAVELSAAGERGYSATGALGVVDVMRSSGLFVRPLGNVVYIMCTPITPEVTRKQLSSRFANALQTALSSEELAARIAG